MERAGEVITTCHDVVHCTSRWLARMCDASIYLELSGMGILDDPCQAIQHPRGDAALHLQLVQDGLASRILAGP